MIEDMYGKMTDKELLEMLENAIEIYDKPAELDAKHIIEKAKQERQQL